jgi:hypothetical protein
MIIKNNKTFLVAIILVLMYSCKTKTEFTIKNNSNILIDSIKVSNGYDYIFTGEVLNNQSVKSNLKFTGLTPRQDGSFFIEIYPQKTFFRFGYYTNGIQPEPRFIIEIKRDTILLKEIL